MENKVISPLTKKNQTIEIKSIQSSEIIYIYEKYFKFDVSKYFEGIDQLKLMKCLQTHYMFYHPSTEGDKNYYAEMGKFEWYYNPSRWEHRKALEIISENQRVLEVGSGSGFFIQQLVERGAKAVGLELSEKALNDANGRGVYLRNETIEDHSKMHINNYEVICSFQVLEHISDPLSFIKSKLECLKKGGRMIIGVPNNDSYLKDNKMYSKVLNMPPHHVGLWTLESLKSLETLFEIELDSVFYEPLAEGNVDTYLWNKVNSFFGEVSFFSRLIWKLRVHKVLKYFLLKNSDKLIGNSMLVVFSKK